MRIDSLTLSLIHQEFGEYDLSQVMGGGNDVYLRFGYWRKVDTAKLQELVGGGIDVVEVDDYDDECGYLYHYRLL